MLAHIMLPPFIIDQIRQREKRERQRHESRRPRLELPLERLPTPPALEEPNAEDDEQDRGVVIVDLMS